MHSKILIDGYNLDLEAGTGVATYARNLSFRLHDLGHQVDVLYGSPSVPKDPLLREIAFFDRKGLPPTLWERMTFQAEHLAPRFFPSRARPVPVTGSVVSTAFESRLPYFDRIWNSANLFTRAGWNFAMYGYFTRVVLPVRPDLVHWTYPLPVTVPGTKNIYTLHDLVPLRLPYTTLEVKKHYLAMVSRIAKRADHIVTVSETSRRDIINLLGVPEERVTNTYQAVDIPSKYSGKSEEVVRREVEGALNLPYRGYFLFFGAIEPKKNVGRMIEAYLASKAEAPLVLVGSLAWKSEQEMRILNDDVVRYLETVDKFTIPRSRVMRIGYAPFPLLVSLIRGAKAVLFPSLYEGFGLPALEAMKLGTPVLTSTGGSMPEVAGDGALLVNPYDTRDIAEGIRALDNNADLRQSLVHKGSARAALFSPEAYSKRLEELYRRIL